MRLYTLLALLLLLAARTVPAQPAAQPAQCTDAAFHRVLAAVPAGSPSDARGIWLSQRWMRWPGKPDQARYRLHYSATGQIVHRSGEAIRGADITLSLDRVDAPLPTSVTDRFRHVGAGVTLALHKRDLSRITELHRGQLVLTQEDAGGRALDATHLQSPGALDELYADAEAATDLGVLAAADASAFTLWAPTAAAVVLCLHDAAEGGNASLHPMRRHAGTGLWRTRLKGDLRGQYYTYLVDVFVRGVGLVRNRVTDPYALSLGPDSRRTWIGSLDDRATVPKGWDLDQRPSRVSAAVDMVIYELHVRDFSLSDASVHQAHRGKYLAFTDERSNGMRHLRDLARAGLTDLHLLPVFDLATVPERGCVTPLPSGAPDSEAQQATIAAVRDRDCFNWGYDPWHYTAPEGSYATDPGDGAVRIREFRQMVMALHRAGLRVGMDVVYNHTTASGQVERSVLDRIVPGYYQRLDAGGAVERSTCCDNTATEHRMMAKLMRDSVVVWARDYHIDSFRFDLMGHQPRAAMEELQLAVNLAAGVPIQLIGEGWNFGEVANGQRFVQAAQGMLNGTGIATFSDRARDAVRGGGCCDSGIDLIRRQGYVNGLHYDPNAAAAGLAARSDLMRTADLVRVGLAGSLRDFELTTWNGPRLALHRIDYAGMPAGYVSEPGEVVNYVENHDNPTLFDLNVFKLPLSTSREDRARVQILAAATTAFSQGIAYFHAGIDLLRSKSLDRNSYDSGDWFNRIDWTYQDNHFGSGLPPAQDNAAQWSLMRPLLANPAIKPTPTDIAWTRDAFRDLLRLRASSSLFRLRSAAEIRQRLSFPNSGPQQQPTVLVGQLDGRGYPGAVFAGLLYFINVDVVPQTLTLAAEAGRDWQLHPLQRDPSAADPRAREAGFDAASGAFTVPARSAVVFVLGE